MKRGTRNELKRIFNDGKFNRQKAAMLIDGLWRDEQWLYEELGLATSDFCRVDPDDEKYNPRYLYKKEDNKNNASWATMLGYGHNVYADFTQVFGFFNTATSFHETVIGAYSKELDWCDTCNWLVQDPLFRVGNGLSAAERSDAFTIYKDGHTEFINSIVLGEHKRCEACVTKDGSLQFSNGELSYYYNLEWHTIGGSSLPEGTLGDILYYGTGGWSVLHKGGYHDFLVSEGGYPRWRYMIPDAEYEGSLIYSTYDYNQMTQRWHSLDVGNEGDVLCVGQYDTLEWLPIGKWIKDIAGMYTPQNVGIGTNSQISSKLYIGADSGQTYAIEAYNQYGNSISAVSYNGAALYGIGSTYGVYGKSNQITGVGVYGQGTNSYGVHGHSFYDWGVYGSSQTSYGGVFSGLGVNILADLFMSGTKIISSDGKVTPTNGLTTTYTDVNNHTLVFTNGILTAQT